MATNNSLNNQCLNDFSVTRSQGGGSVVTTTQNTSTSASSVAAFVAKVGGDAAGDAYYNANSPASSRSYSWGLQTTTDNWQLCRGGSLATNILLQATSAGNFTLNYSGSGTTGGLTINNTNNTGSSQSYLSINTAGTSAGKQIIQLSNTVDSLMSISRASATNSPLVFSGGNPGTNDCLTIDSTGSVTNALQPAFMASQGSALTNLTGDGTVYTLIADVENFDNASNYNNATGIFTAPKTGRYFFYAQVLLTSVGVGHTGCEITLQQAGSATAFFAGSDSNPATGRSLSNNVNDYCLKVQGMIQLTAGDTMKVQLLVTGSTKTIGVFGSSGGQFYTSFGGYLLPA